MDEKTIQEIQSHICGKLYHYSGPWLGNSKQRGMLYKIIEATIENQENGSVVLFGERASGKTYLLNKVLGDLHQRYSNFTVVRLNGLLHAEDERITVQHFIKQLTQESNEDSSKLRAYIDMSKYLLELLASKKAKTEPTILVLDEFDLFATLPRKQTFLYTLLDLLQTKDVLLCIVCITSRVDVLETLEKRVKSRLSQTQLFITSFLSEQEPSSILKEFLQLPANFSDEIVSKQWNKQLEKSIPKLQDVLETHLSYNNDFTWFASFIRVALTRLNKSHPYLTEEDFEWASSIVNSDFKESYIEELPLYEIGLLIAMDQLRMKKEFTEYHFEHIYNEYHHFATKHLPQHAVKKPLAWKSFEHLIELEFVRTVNSDFVKGNKQTQMMVSNISTIQLRDVLKNEDNNIPTWLQKYGTSWLE